MVYRTTEIPGGMKKYILPILSLAFTWAAQGQSPWFMYGKSQADTLASDFFYGRGHVEQGERKAAYHIATEFQKMGLSQFAPAPSFYQPFKVSANLFPEVPVCIADAMPLVSGVHFIPDAASGPIRKTLPLIFLDSITLSNPKTYSRMMGKSWVGKGIVVDRKGIKDESLKQILQNVLQFNPLKADLIIELQDKLTFSAATQPKNFAHIHVLRSMITRETAQVKINMPTSFIPEIQSSNVTGYVWGKEVTDTFVVFTAHYDHLGMLGRHVIFPGANDNASGTAMLLTLAKYFSQPENRPRYSVAFIAFAGEEAGLLGSQHYVRKPIIPLKKIKFLVNLDMLGTGDEGITVVNATEHRKEFDQLQALNTANKWLAQIKPRGKAANSDHYPFSEAGVKAFFMYTMGGTKAYHDIYDRAETLPLTKFEEVFQLLTAFHAFLDRRPNP